MPEKNYQNEIQNLNNEIANLRQQLQAQSLTTDNYRVSLEQARKQSANKPQARDINPIIKQIRQKNLSMRERQQLVTPELYPSAPEDIFYQWIAPSRVTVKRDRQWYWTMGLILMIMIAIAVIFREIIWIAVILAFFFAVYVNASIPAADTIFRFTRQGIEIGDGEGLELYSWGQILDYSFFFKSGTEVLYLDTILAVPQRIVLLFTQEDRKSIQMILEAHLPYKVPPRKQGAIARYVEGIYIPLTDFKALQEKVDQYYDQKYSEIIHGLKREGKLPQEFTIDDMKNAESIQTMKLLEEMERQQEEEAKRLLGI